VDRTEKCRRDGKEIGEVRGKGTRRPEPAVRAANSGKTNEDQLTDVQLNRCLEGTERG